MCWAMMPVPCLGVVVQQDMTVVAYFITMRIKCQNYGAW